MNIQGLRFKAISHLPQGQLVQFLSVINSNPLSQNRYSTTTAEKDSQSRQQTFGSTPETNLSNRNIVQRPRRDSIIKSFTNTDKNQDLSKLKQECTKLRFQKIALQNSMQKLKQQLARKDEIIQRLNGQAQGGNTYVSNGSHIMHHNIQNIQGLRHTISPIY